MPKGLISAIRFLTVLPVKTRDEFDTRRMAPFFPITGLLIGLLLFVFDQAAHMLWSRSVVAGLDIVWLIILTGGLHIDGVADTGDGIFSHRSREKALAIMKDSRIGAMGLITVISVLFVKYAGLLSLDENRRLVLLIVPAYARSGILFAVRFLAYGRPDGGMGQGLFDRPLKAKDFWALSIPVGISVALGIQGILLNAAFILFSFFIIYFYRKKMGCITGDMLGAMIESTEAFLFLAASVSLL
jgi:adenosylcobinamide-GDP ribazoletransferase